ncbi:pyridine nucleotide-disulfide oxidoreductase [Pseudomonas sp. 09C 129]|uniref:FAD-dependent oxidoreductase n=1 Tax=Pseudomonas sp. 09C 129 TaxID=2054915 RepID=UPI000C6D6396|nr:FAD-dependent oxidoreductase [Pseudomonas sp. 09C 129]AUG02418.1 pyridine nucleotide-disulfide oxidoreductase [Pseudomonas sp. 09C 129]
MTFYVVARLDQLPEDRGTRVQVGAEAVLLVRTGDQVRAYQADCPHAGAPLEQGAVYQGRLICPWHKGVFACASGQVCEPPPLASLKRYKVDIRHDNRVWVADQPMAEPAPPRQADSRRLLVIGAGAAGAAAVATLRAKGFGRNLTWIDKEARPAYDRTALSKYVLAGEMPPAEVPPLLEPEFYRKADLQVLQTEVLRLDPRRRQILLANGQRLDYDAALLATGAEPRLPAIEGADLPGVFMLRSREDAARLLEQALPGKRVAIVGDSFIGLEAASALRKRGLMVHLIGRHPVPLQRQLGERIGSAIRALHERHGVIYHAGCEARALVGEGQVQQVVLDNDQRIAVDLVLFGIGVSPATAFVEGLDRAEDGSLKADASLAVADGLWAAGDLVSFPCDGRSQRIEHWRVAQQQGQLAACNMLGEQLSFSVVPFFWTYFYDQTFEVLGHARRWNQIAFEGEPEQYRFIALLCFNEQVESVVACEYPRAMALLSQRMQRPLSRSEALELIHGTPE